eukprot:TRINITY_DN630_c0_g1_i1.p1 TRINITY_DN630_c0_g1~~TRINITY_DN630_c0_g1_i1.p1  ORF type:complete len:847 (+),score=293.94 TRINITY_DN630_c0_g1_i1:62-2542(+)
MSARALSLLALLAASEAQNAITVGWREPVVPQTQTVAAGGTVTFAWGGFHNVFKAPSRVAWDRCQTRGNNEAINGGAAGGRATWQAPNTAGRHYFFCTIGDHCQNRLKVEIVVVAPVPVTPTPPLVTPVPQTPVPTQPPSPDLFEMAEVTSYPTTLRADEYTLQMANPPLTMRMRGYNPTGATMTRKAVGPVLRFRAGDTVTVRLQNDLRENGPVSTGTNSYHEPGTTNLHTHGLHVNAETPEDNIMMDVDPGTSFTYRYQIPPDHASGTHWYHAHRHGNTALQAGGGMVGMIVVEDAADEVPAAVRALPELLLLAQWMVPSELMAIAAEMDGGAGDGWTESGASGVQPGVGYLTVNGQYQPTATVEQGQWTRVRMVYSSIGAAVEFSLRNVNGAGCEWQLLAKDGIFVDDAPRALNTVFMGPGNRAEVVVRCARAGSFEIVGEVGGQLPSTMLTVDVTRSFRAAAGDLPTFTAKRPAYLAHVYQGVENQGVVVEEHSLTLAGAGGGCQVRFDNVQKSYDGVVAHGAMPLGSVQKWRLDGARGHPFHIHVNSFQLGPDTADTSGYFQPGDWHDVFFMPDGVSATEIYFSVDRFRTKSILHCHFLDHEDRGCMGFIDITGGGDGSTGLSGTPLVSSDMTPAPTPAPPTPVPVTPAPPVCAWEATENVRLCSGANFVLDTDVFGEGFFPDNPHCPILPAGLSADEMVTMCQDVCGPADECAGFTFYTQGLQGEGPMCCFRTDASNKDGPGDNVCYEKAGWSDACTATPQPPVPTPQPPVPTPQPPAGPECLDISGNSCAACLSSNGVCAPFTRDHCALFGATWTWCGA